MSELRPWLQNYPPGVPSDIDLDQYRSIVSVLQQSCDQFRNRPAFENMGKSISYGDLDRLSQQFAAYLLFQLKLKKGDRIALMLPNILQYPIAIFGALPAVSLAQRLEQYATFSEPSGLKPLLDGLSAEIDRLRIVLKPLADAAPAW